MTFFNDIQDFTNLIKNSDLKTEKNSDLKTEKNCNFELCSTLTYLVFQLFQEYCGDLFRVVLFY